MAALKPSKRGKAQDEQPASPLKEAPKRVELWQGWDNDAGDGFEAALHDDTADGIDLTAFGM